MTNKIKFFYIRLLGFNWKTLILLGICLLCRVVVGQQFQINGNIYLSLWDGNGNHTQDESSEFSLSVSNCSWEIVMTPANKNGVDYTVLSYDGAQLYVFQDIETMASKMYDKMKADGNQLPPSNERNLGIAWVINSEIPHDLGADGAGQIWLPYASGCYFKKIATNELEVPWVFGAKKRPIMANESIMRRAFWTTQIKAPQIPETICYLSDSGDYTNGQYSVNSYTNFQNLVLPLESVFEVFVRGQDKTKINLLFRYVVKATNFKQLERALTFPPNVPVLTGVTDHRFNNPSDPAPNTPVSYFVADKLLTKDEAKNTPYFGMAKLHRNNPTAEIRGRGGKFFILAIMAGISLIFLTLVIRNMLQTKTNK